MRVSFDSNAWEAIFDADDRGYCAVRDAFRAGVIQGRICAAGFRIEAIPRADRLIYFAAPHTEVRSVISSTRKGQLAVAMSLGPDNDGHPGLPKEQIPKFESAIAAGFRLMRGNTWIGLPSPQEIENPSMYVAETLDERSAREVRQAQAFDQMRKRGVGKAAFDDQGGWRLPPEGPVSAKKFWKACAEWADAELVSAHIAYRNDILCTNDIGNQSSRSIFDTKNRSWLETNFDIRFLKPKELFSELNR